LLILERSGAEQSFILVGFNVCSVKHINALGNVAMLQLGITTEVLLQSLLRSASLQCERAFRPPARI